ncbi:cytochrome P450 [Nocardioides yefusunii]|uniref:Cytochrome P450 n=1 Tax=Nocardioides yefusunii TaxID=2500546 RepID=A0ABW1QXN1_9ACTN|nr:cytochrome P450 [Nocardioides yefusunii]
MKRQSWGPSVRRVVLRTAAGIASKLSRGGGGIDLSAIKRFPEHTHFVLQRNAVDPVPRLAEVRAAEPVHKVASILGMDVWLVTGDDAARETLVNSDDLRNDLRDLLGKRTRSAAEQVGGLGMTDAPDHTRLRKMLTPEFTKRRLARLEPAINEVVKRSLDDMAAAGPVVDLVDMFGFQIPYQVICDLLGLPEVDRDAFRALGAARFDLSQGGVGSFDAAKSTREFLIDLCERQKTERTIHPDGLLAGIIDSYGGDFDAVEVGGLADGVFIGGYETSASMLSLGTYVLLQNPEYYSLLRTGSEEEVAAVVEELLRYVCPVQVAFPRFARRDFTLAGVRIRQGDVVLTSLAGSNRDDTAHAAGDSFDPTLPSAGHLAFGHGLHRCVGAELARMELRQALRALATQFPDLSLAVSPDELVFSPLSAVYSVEALPVRLQA